MNLEIQIGIALAVLGAVGTNLGALCKHRGACNAPLVDIRRPLATVRDLLRSRWFVIGVAIAVSAGLLHFAAIALAPLSLVQAVLAAGVVLLAVIAERFFGYPVGTRQWWAVSLSAVGLVLLALTFPALHGSHSRFAASAMIAFEGGLMVISILLVLGPRREKFRAHRGVLFGAAAGTLFGLSDVTVKALTGELGSGPMAILASPWLIVAVTTGILAQYTAVRALQEGEAVPVIALTGLAANVSNIAGGVIVFGDPLAGSPVGLCLQALAFVMICSAALLAPSPVTRQRA
jgi:drug/metabolite transporter (DMT)-like permease